MISPLFFEYPQDGASWEVEDQFMLGRDILVAPFFEDAIQRELYLPPGAWVDLQDQSLYQGGRRLSLGGGAWRCVVLGRAGAAIPTAEPALHSGAQDFSKAQWWLLGPGQAHQGFWADDDGNLRELLIEDGQRIKKPWPGAAGHGFQRL